MPTSQKIVSHASPEKKVMKGEVLYTCITIIVNSNVLPQVIYTPVILEMYRTESF